jgi:hypothetical protein
VIECQRQIEMRMAKVSQAEGVIVAASEIQKQLLQCVSVRWTAEMIPVWDCWFENSDYERARFVCNSNCANVSVRHVGQYISAWQLLFVDCFCY